MPVDAWGNRTEMIVSALSTLDRMNIGRSIEHEVNGSMEMLTEELRLALNLPSGIPTDDPDIQHAVRCIREELQRRGKVPSADVFGEEIQARVNGSPTSAFEELLHFYKLASPKMHDVLLSPEYQGTPEYHLQQAMKEGMYLWAPIDTPKPWLHLEWDDANFDRPRYEAAVAEHTRLIKQLAKEDVAEADRPKPPNRDDFGTLSVTYGGVVGDLKNYYPARRGPVWYRGQSGRESVTVNDILVADTYVVLLEKTGSDWSGVASAKHQHHGLPAKLSRQDKYSLPSRANPVRIFGEAEVRLTTTTTTGDVVSEMLEMSNSPAAHKNVVRNILMAQHPSNIEDVLDRNEITEGSNRSQVFVAHALECAGIRFVYVDHSDEGEVYPADPIGIRADLGLDGDDESEDEPDLDDDVSADENEDDTEE